VSWTYDTGEFALPRGLLKTAKAVLSVSPPVYEAAYNVLYGLTGKRVASRRVDNDGDAQAVFQEIWQSDFWTPADEPTVSGTGSTLAQTARIRVALPGLLRQLSARSLLDAPCGDLFWIRTVDLGDVRYVGADIVPELIERNRKDFPDREFLKLDITKDPLPSTDLWMCRDCLFHLPFDMAMATFENFARSNIPYLLTTTFRFPRENYDIKIGDFRPINLEKPPYSLPRPLRMIRDYAYPSTPRFLGLWSRKQVARRLGG
jgi:hypothetical protein